MIGKTISHYRILDKIGSGGMGQVYLAEDLKLKRKVALKFLPAEISAETDRSRFLLEAQAVAAINHPNVCIIYEIDELSDQPFIALEYVDGETLKSRTKKTPLDLELIIDFAIQMAEGLEAAHSQDIIHRDIKSDNIMITAQDRLKIMDFGLAKLKGSKQLTKTSSTIGTLAYMAPEQIEGKTIDARSDIFSYGIVLYEMITGRLPFKGDYEAAMMYAILNEQPEPAENIRHDLPSELLHVLYRAIEKNPAERYQSVKEMLIDLKRLKRDTSKISAESFQEIRKKTIPRKRSKYIYAATLSSIALLAVVLIFLTNWFFPESDAQSKFDERSVAVMYFTNNTGNQNLDHWRRAITDLMIADLSQSKYLRVLSADKLYDILKDLDQLEASSFSAEIFQQIAKRGRVSHIVYGTFSKAGENFRINVQVKQPFEDELIGSNIVEGQGEASLFPMVDQLTNHIKTRFSFSEDELKSDIDRDVATITTNSPEAYKYYTIASEYFDQRDYKEAINWLEKAVEVDPEFAYAYRTMGITYSNMGYWSKRREYLKKALELSHRVSLRERYLIEADYYSETNKRRAISAFKKLLEVYPDDVTGNINLGYLYNWIRELDLANKYFQRAIKSDPSVFISYMNSAWAYTEAAKYDSAIYILDRYRLQYEDNEVIRAYFAELNLYKHNYALALQEIDKALAFKADEYNNFELKGDIFLCMGLLDSARTIYEKLLTMDESRAQYRGHRRLWSLAGLEGRIADMRKHLAAGMALAEEMDELGWQITFLYSSAWTERIVDNDDQALKHYQEIIRITAENQITWGNLWGKHFKAELLAKSGNMEEVWPIIKELKNKNLNDVNRGWHGNYLYLLAKIDIQRGHYVHAIDSLHAAIKALTPTPEKTPNASMFFDLARAYQLNGDFNQAIAWYQKLQALTIGRITLGYFYVKSFYRLGQCYQQKGWEGKAIEQYERFLHLWQDADHPFPEIADARNQLKSLQLSL